MFFVGEAHMQVDFLLSVLFGGPDLHNYYYSMNKVNSL